MARPTSEKKKMHLIVLIAMVHIRLNRGMMIPRQLTGQPYQHLCGQCHRANGKAVETADLKEVDAFIDYSESVHGKGLTEKGLLPTAVCTDCHTTHYILKESDESSSVNPKNIPATCASCHKGIYDDYISQ